MVSRSCLCTSAPSRSVLARSGIISQQAAVTFFYRHSNPHRPKRQQRAVRFADIARLTADGQGEKAQAAKQITEEVMVQVLRGLWCS